MSEKKDTYSEVKKWVDGSGQELLRKTLPPGYAVAAWASAALAYISSSKEVLGCTPTSIVGCFLTVASFGLRLDGVTGHAYLRALPIKDSSGAYVRSEAQVQLGYRGMVELAYRNPEVQDIEPCIIYQNDKFDFRKGSQPYLHHTWDVAKPRGAMVAVYAGIRYRNEYFGFQIYPIDDVLALRKSILEQSWIRVDETASGTQYFKKPFKGEWRQLSSQEANHYPWIGHLVPMVLKTSIRWAQKYWPTVGSEFSRAASLSELDDAGISQGMGAIGEVVAPTEEPSREPDTKPNLKGDLLAKMLSEAGRKTGNGAQPEEEPKKPEEEPKKPEEEPKPEEPVAEAPKPEEPKQVEPDAAQKPANKKSKAGLAASREPTEEEKAAILQAEREEWELNQKLQG
jgi:phage RecT family recombinase